MKQKINDKYDGHEFAHFIALNFKDNVQSTVIKFDNEIHINRPRSEFLHCQRLAFDRDGGNNYVNKRHQFLQSILNNSYTILNLNVFFYVLNNLFYVPLINLIIFFDPSHFSGDSKFLCSNFYHRSLSTNIYRFQRLLVAYLRSTCTHICVLA